ncbi:MAG: NAD-dependent epimerase/dehydratase family protein [Opitutaceae bacterium]|nr:NAD-dependent epimerase/dehydratase family protein [Opitutaceae bacterium]
MPDLVVLGCGYVGAAVVRDALRSGRKVTALTRNPETAESLRRIGAQVVVARLEESRWHSALPAAGVDVVNTVSAGGGGVAGYATSYVRGLESARLWAAKGPARCLVYTSSTSVYGPDAGEEVTESSPAHPQAPTGELLLQAERLVHSAEGLSWKFGYVLRLTGIYGPGRHHLLDQVRAGTGSVAGTPDVVLNLIHRDDAASAIGQILGAPDRVAGPRVFNVSDDGRATRGEIVGWLAKALGVPLPAFSGEPAPGRRSLTPNRVVRNDLLKATWGWTPSFPSFREGYASILNPLPFTQPPH